MSIAERTDIRVLHLDPRQERVETGVVVFGDDDWPGVFIRGDHAFGYANALAGAIALIESQPQGPSIAMFELCGLLDLLKASNVNQEPKP